ncbi:MAG: NAD-dependent epimerase/dehydratase family protein [Phycisphaerae bacterium]
MKGPILITGGAGFIGGHLSNELIAHGYDVRILDVLQPQVHGPDRRRPDYLHPKAELIVGDVCDPAAVKQATRDVDAVVHLAASVGVGQSMYEIAAYTNTNNMGTAVLLEALVERPVRKLVVASSMSVYGEGLYQAASGRLVCDASRDRGQLQAHIWEPLGPSREPLSPLATPESKHPDLASVYALSKYDQERMSLIVGRAYGIPTVALRFFNVYGPNQALSNPYTGVLAIFANRLLNGMPPLIYEDGQQQRDFVHVKDIAAGIRLSLERDVADDVLNLGSGEPRTISSVAADLADATGRGHVKARVTGKYRAGDIRHCYADIGRARRLLGYAPRVDWARGLSELADWLQGQSATDRVEQAGGELERRGLSV